MEENTIFKVFALVNDNNEITDITGGIITDTCPDGYVEIDEGSGDRYAHCQGNYLPYYKEDYLDGTVYHFTYDGEIHEKTAEEIEADKTAIENAYISADDRLGALEESQEMQDEIIADILDTM